MKTAPCDHWTYWWAPEINRYVKQLFTNTANGRVRNKSGLELVEYGPAGE